MKQERFCCLSFLLWLEHILLLFKTIWGQRRKIHVCAACLIINQRIFINCVSTVPGIIIIQSDSSIYYLLLVCRCRREC